MSIRDQFRQKPTLGLAAGAATVLLAAVVLARTYWPEHHADLSKAFYTVDDGATWFKDDATKVAPFDHGGKPAVVAHVYSYADGGKQFCAYVAQFKPDAKARLEAAIAETVRAGKPPESTPLYGDRTFLKTGVQVKRPGAQNAWMNYDDPRANVEVFTIKSPDGSVVDEVFP